MSRPRLLFVGHEHAEPSAWGFVVAALGAIGLACLLYAAFDEISPAGNPASGGAVPAVGLENTSEGVADDIRGSAAAFDPAEVVPPGLCRATRPEAAGRSPTF